MFLVIAYDISDDKRRLQMAKELERWGNRTQFSVFECDLNEREEHEMMIKLKAIRRKEDALRVYRICAECVKKSEILSGEDLYTNQDYYQI